MGKIIAECINKKTGSTRTMSGEEFFGDMRIINTFLDTTDDSENIINVLRTCMIQLRYKYNMSEEMIINNIKADLKLMRKED